MLAEADDLSLGEKLLKQENMTSHLCDFLIAIAEKKLEALICLRSKLRK